MKNRKTIANHGDLFLFPRGDIGYISDITWNENEKANFYTLKVIYKGSHPHVCKEGSVREFVYHQKSIQGFIMHNPSVKYYSIK